MNYQLKGFGFSFIMHTALLLLIITLNSSIGRFSKPVVIDFSIEDSSLKEVPKTSPAPRSEVAKAREPEQQKPVTAKQEQIIQQEAVPRQISATSNTAAEGQAPVSASRPPASFQPSGGSSSGTANSARTEPKKSSGDGQGTSADGMRLSYLKEHFAYIRNIVQQKLSYPKVARKMGWEGKVILSFVVCIDGHARDITIREGSGIEMLDKNAIAAVRNASPFPKPPVEAQLIIPINYSLN